MKPGVGGDAADHLTVNAPTVSTSDTVHITGHVSDEHLVRDVYVRVWNRNAKIPVKKAFYQPNRLTGDRTKMDFEADIPLWTGSNLVQVFARESNDVQSLQTVVVLKRAPNELVAQPFEAQQPGTPRRQDVPGGEDQEEVRPPVSGFLGTVSVLMPPWACSGSGSSESGWQWRRLPPSNPGAHAVGHGRGEGSSARSTATRAPRAGTW